MIVDAKGKIEDINNSMKADSRWDGQADIVVILSNLDSLCEHETGGIGYFLKTL